MSNVKLQATMQRLTEAQIIASQVSCRAMDAAREMRDASAKDTSDGKKMAVYAGAYTLALHQLVMSNKEVADLQFMVTLILTQKPVVEPAPAISLAL